MAPSVLARLQHAGALAFAAPLLACAPAPTEQFADSPRRASLTVAEHSVVAELESFGEGPAIDADNRLFLSDPFNDAVLMAGDGGNVDLWASIPQPNGHAILANGRHVVMSAEGPLILAGDGKRIVALSAPFGTEPFLSPNDVAPDGRGGFWFTDPGRFGEPDPGRVFHVDNQDVVTLAAVDINFPNGIAVSEDGSQVFVNESRRNRVLVFQAGPQGRLSERRVFAELPAVETSWTPSGRPEPDGLGFDRDGRLYVAHFGTPFLRVLDPNGELIASLDTGAPSITNFIFDPQDRTTLFVTAARGDSLADGGQLLRIRISTIPAETTSR